MDIDQLIQRLRLEWSQPHRNNKSDLLQPDFDLVCLFAEQGVNRASIIKRLGDVPEEMVSFWEICEWVELFKDQKFGQWGLRCLTPKEAIKETNNYKKSRPIDSQRDDLIIGRFFGDSELLLLRCAPKQPDFRSIMVVLPIDSRENWYIAAPSLTSFLFRYTESEGEKFWVD